MVREAGVGREAAAARGARMRGAQFLHLAPVRRQHVAAQLVDAGRRERAPAARDPHHVTGATPTGGSDDRRRVTVNSR